MEQQPETQNSTCIFAGQDSTHYFALNDDKKADYGELKKNLPSALCPPVDGEKHYVDFENCFLCPNEDPFTYLWEQKEPRTCGNKKGLTYCLSEKER